MTTDQNSGLLIRSNKKDRTPKGGAAIWGLVMQPDDSLQNATDGRYLFRQGTDKKIQIIRYRQPGAVFRKEPVDKIQNIDWLFVYGQRKKED